MDLNEYQLHQQRTANPDMAPMRRFEVAAMGLCGESGEVIDHVKKWAGQGHDFDRTKVLRELGDVLYYVSEAAFALGYSLQEVADANITKLRHRYPDGFDASRSVNRPAGNGG